MAGYPRVVGGYVAGGYVAGAHQQGYHPPPPHPHPGLGIYGQPPPYGYAPAYPPPALLAGPHHPAHLGMYPPPEPEIRSPPWRPMLAPGSPPLGEGHVPMPLNPELYGGTWGNTAGGGAAPGVTITFSARPQKPFKTARLLARGTKSGTTAVGNLIAQLFVGTDLQQGELGFIDLESIGAATAFDTWVSLKQAEPGVWIRVQGQLTAYPTGTDFETYTVTAMGHYLH
jgi:hypothetical protein